MVKEGDELVLPCPATGSPDPRLAFTRSELDPITQTMVERPLGEQGTTSDKDSLGRRAVLSQVVISHSTFAPTLDLIMDA